MTNPLPPLNLSPLSSALPGDASASTYADVNGLTELKRNPTSEKSINAVAQQVEAMFLQMMLKSMRDANFGNDLDGSTVNMYQDMFDKQIALSISQHQDLGLGAMLKRQLSGYDAAAQPSVPGTVHTSALVAPTRPAVLAQTPAEFVRKIMPAIERAAADVGLDPRGLLAQAALETGWGQRMPQTAAGTPSHNLFGIKATDDWSGPRASAETIEFAHGVATQRRAAFRAYDSIEESVRDFAKLLKNSPRYRDVVTAGYDAGAYVERLAACGYATDPEYANKLNQILNGGALQAALLPRSAKL